MAELQCPVYATRLLQLSSEKSGLARCASTCAIDRGFAGRYAYHRFVRRYLATHNPLDPETCALLLESQGTRILHTADWKIDARPVIGSPWSPSTWKALAAKGIDAVICDSTNATTPGRSPTEGEVGDALVKLLHH